MDLDRDPVLVFWETTRACLLACKHCRAEADSRALPGELSTEEGLRLIGDLTGFDRPPVLILTGGDVLMRTDLFDLVGAARRAALPVGVAPSVTPLLTPDVLSRLRDLGVSSVSISLDGGRPGTHDRIRGTQGHFDRTRAAIEEVARLGFRTQVNTAVMADNVEELPDVARVVKESGASIWEVFFLVKVGRGRAVGELQAGQNEDVAHFLVDASRYGVTVRTVEGPFFRRVAAWRKQAGDDIDPGRRFGLGPLYARLSGRLREVLGEPSGPPRVATLGTRDGKGILFISSDGWVCPAGFLPLALGHVRNRRIVDIYRRHPLLRAIREGSLGGRCGVCPYQEQCGGSRARAYAAWGDPLGEDPACAYVPPEPHELAQPMGGSQ